MISSLFSQQSEKEIWADYIEVVNEKIINTELSEFSPTFWSDYIVYVKSNPRQKLIDKNINEGYFDLYFTESKKGYLSKGANLSTSVNTNYHEGPASFTQDGVSACITRVDYDGTEFSTNEDKVAQLKLFETRYDKGNWQKPFKSDLNMENVASCHPAIDSKARYMIFASDRPNGYGKMDLYISYKINGQWGPPQNMGSEINSKGNDWFPQLNERGFLYYASDGYSNNGDLDIYQCELIDSNNYNPICLPYPINTRYDDFGICVDENGISGYLSSNRPGGSGKDDIYSFNSFQTIYSYGNENYNSLFLSIIDMNSGQPLEGALIRYQPIDESEVQSFDSNIFSFDPKMKYDSLKSNQSGSAKIKLHEGYTLVEIIHQDKESFQKVISNHHTQKHLEVRLADQEKALTQKPEIVYIEKEVPAKEVINNVVVEEGSIIVFDNIYYDYNSYKLTKGAATELDKLIEIMLANANLKIQLAAHTDSRGKKDYNQNLSQKRAESARSYLVSKGVSGKNIVAIGYGESKLRNHCKDGINCSEAEHIYNRRTEVKILQK